MKKFIRNAAILSGLFIIALLATQNLRAGTKKQTSGEMSRQELSHTRFQHVFDSKCGKDNKEKKDNKKVEKKESKCGKGKEKQDTKKAKDSKCGDGKCGDGKTAKDDKKAKESKCGNGKCGTD